MRAAAGSDPNAERQVLKVVPHRSLLLGVIAGFIEPPVLRSLPA